MLVLLPAMLLPLVGAVCYFVLFSHTQWAPVLYAGTKVFTVVWPICALLLLAQPLPRWRPDRVAWARALPTGLASGVVIGVSIVLLAHGPFADLLASAAPRIQAKVESLGIAEHYWAFGLFLAVIHAAIEEYYWRWFVFGQLRKQVPEVAAHIIAAVAFMAHHIVITCQFFPVGWGVLLGVGVGVGGAVFSTLYARQHTLFGAWVAHMGIDLAILWVGHELLTGTLGHSLGR